MFLYSQVSARMLANCCPGRLVPKANNSLRILDTDQLCRSEIQTMQLRGLQTGYFDTYTIHTSWQEPIVSPDIPWPALLSIQ